MLGIDDAETKTQVATLFDTRLFPPIATLKLNLREE